jgi:NADPH:quinone reductase-like Zn-dependent oxidoreductase
MRAVVTTRHGGPEVLRVEERPDPPIGAGEVRIAVRAAGLNFADTLARVGLYPDAPDPPCVVGYEVAGEVESVGEGVTSSPSETGSWPAPASAGTPSW